eukprot:TRINITY_DN1500_c0_g1_i1.p1 TRINITY_DN1500_c0_g1~~TRINITY_DN1500_c0_g1_i1.p1  ORF type:complete len:640 (-),score=202.25 TRINITY_DN1500_c0_g1_i1:224-2143(-)
MAAVEVPSTAINIPRAGDPSALFASKRKRGRPQRKKVTNSNNSNNNDVNSDDFLSSSPDSKEPKLSLDDRVEDAHPVAPLPSPKIAAPPSSSVESSNADSSEPSASASTSTSTSTLEQNPPVNANDNSKSGDSSSVEQQTKALPPSPKQLRKKRAKAKAKAKKAANPPAAAQPKQEDVAADQESKQEVAEIVQPQPSRATPQPVSVLKQPNQEASSSAADQAADAALHLSSIQWKIKLSIIEGGLRKYVVEKQALPCFEQPSIINCAKLPINNEKNVEGQWFIVRQDRSFSKPLPAQLENIGKTRETRQGNQKTYSKSRPPTMPKKGQLVIECFVSGNHPEDDVQPDQLTYLRTIAFDSGVTTTGAKTNLHLHCPAAENNKQDVVVVGAKSGCIHTICLFIPSSDLTPSWQRLLKSHSSDDEESPDEGSSSPVKKKRKEELAPEGKVISSQSSLDQKRRKVVWAEDVNVRYYIGPASCKKFTKKHKNLQLDRCADVKIKCLDKVAKKKGSNYKFHQLELQPVPGIAGGPPSPPLKSARTGSPPPADIESVMSPTNKEEDEHVEIVDEDVKPEAEVQNVTVSDNDNDKKKDDDVVAESSNSGGAVTEETSKTSTDNELRQEKAIDDCAMTEAKTEESSLS